MTKKTHLGALLLGLVGTVCACSDSDPKSPPDDTPSAKSSSELLGLPTLGLPGIFYFTGLGLGGGGLAGILLPAGRSLLKDSDIVTYDDDGGHPSLSLFPQLKELLLPLVSYRRIGAYIDPTKPPVPVRLRNGTMGTRPWMRYIQAKGGAVVRKSAGGGADSSAIVPLGTNLSLKIVDYTQTPQSMSTLPANVPSLLDSNRQWYTYLWACPGYRPFSTDCDSNGYYALLYEGSTDYMFATENGLSFNADGTATDGNQYFMLNDAQTAYQQVIYAGTAYGYSDQDYSYLQVTWAYASWTPIIVDAPYFFSRP